jgi:hypothetical protein
MTHVAFALLFGWAIVAIAEAQTPAEAAMQLAARISSQLPRRATVSLEMQNQTAMTAADLSSFRAALEEELRKSGQPMTATQPDIRMRVTISENARGLLVVAEMLSGENRTVVMQPWIVPPVAESKPRVKIVRRPVWDQPEPLLDLLLLDSDSELLVLSPGAVSSFHRTEGKWILTGVAALSLARPPARDPRGRIQSTSGGLRVYLPGTTCSGTLQPALKFNCAAGNEAWQVTRDASLVGHWVTDRNMLEADGFQGGFYAVASGWFSTAGHRVVDRSGNSLASPDAWGSDVATVENNCGPNPTVVTSDSGDSPDHDQARAYEIASGHGTPASEPMVLPGPVTALWPAETPGQATLIVRNSKTGNYEASRLGLACAE